jgi:hypothetical protein
MKRLKIIVTAIFLLAIFLSKVAGAGEAPPAAEPYSGDLLSRSTLTGDWWGVRNQVAEKGVTFDLRWPRP